MNQSRSRNRTRRSLQEVGVVERLALEGAAADGWTFNGNGRNRIWVRGGRPGDIVEAHLTRDEQGRVEGHIRRVVERRAPFETPPCPHVATCGGCQWLDVPYAAQRAWKRRVVADALASRGMDVHVPEVIPSPDLTWFRNRMDFSFGHTDAGRLILGLHVGTEAMIDPETDAGDPLGRPGGSSAVFDVTRCVLMSEQANALVAAARAHLGETRLRAYDAERRTGVLRSLVLRESKQTGEIAAMLVVASDKHVDGERLACALAAEAPTFTGLLVAVNRRRSRNDPPRTVTAYGGSARVTETIDGLSFTSSVGRFVQVNPGQAARLYNAATGFAQVRPGARVLDLYSGSGGLSLFLAREGATVVGVEVAAEAVKEASVNASLNQLSDRCRFVAGDAASIPVNDVRVKGRFETVVVNPPRGGLAHAAIRTVSDLGPTRVVYVSCNPGTLARDLVQFRRGGYRLSSVQPVDMFPHSGHVEVVAALGRGEGTWT